MREKKTTKKPLEVIPHKMVTLTAEAAEKIKNALNRYSASGVRIQAEQSDSGTMSFSFNVEDKPRSDDLVLEDNAIKLFVDPSSTQYVQGIEIRYVRTEKGSGFSIANPAG
jgi:iron-sulfur cluster assembly protein